MELQDLGQVLGGCLIGSFIVVLAAWYRSDAVRGELLGLDPSWSFSESWASNVTVASAALLAVLGSSDVVASVLGDEADVLGVVVVASAVAAGLVAIAPLIVKASVSTNGHVTAAGLFVAAIVTLTAASFEGLVLALNANEIMEGDAWLWVGMVVLALLAVYGYRSLKTTFALTEAAPESESDTLKGARLIAAAIAGGPSMNITNFAEEWPKVEKQLTPTPSPARRRTSSIL